MSKRIVVDPITRIEGHLRIEADIENGKIKDAYSSGTMVRLLEEILRGRDPRDAWAFVGRVCGVCTSVHSLTSVRCVEDALGITVPPNAELVRNIMFCAQYMHWKFYNTHLCLQKLLIFTTIFITQFIIPKFNGKKYVFNVFVPVQNFSSKCIF